MSDDFYVGYVPKAPASLAAFAVRVIAGLLLLAITIAALLVSGQSQFAFAKFEYGVFRDHEGYLDARPYPMLITRGAQYVLVGPGKHGFGATDFVGKKVKLNGSLIEREQLMMLEVAKAEVAEGPEGTIKPPVETDLGPVTLIGEIVDSKCYLGVMNPGNGKVHRDCAARCISGGVPPAFIARDASGATRTLLLTGADGRPLHAEVLDFVAEPVEIDGRLSRIGPTLVLRAGGIKRIGERIPK